MRSKIRYNIVFLVFIFKNSYQSDMITEILIKYLQKIYYIYVFCHTSIHKYLSYYPQYYIAFLYQSDIRNTSVI